MYATNLTKDQHGQIKRSCGLTRAIILRVERDSHGYPNYLIEAQDNSQFKFRGWWKEGESAGDIRWETENVDGWPESVH